MITISLTNSQNKKKKKIFQAATSNILVIKAWALFNRINDERLRQTEIKGTAGMHFRILKRMLENSYFQDCRPNREESAGSWLFLVVAAAVVVLEVVGQK